MREVDFEGQENLLEADAIAKRISPESPQRGGISAGREVLSRAAEYIRGAQSFAIETTLSGNSTNAAISDAREQSFFTKPRHPCARRLVRR
jgi:predicted ABC-type ATPase